MLTPHLDHVGTPLRRVQQQRKRESGSAPYRVPPLERRDIVLDPCIESAGSVFRRAHAYRRIVGAQTGYDCVPHKCAQRAQEIERSPRRRSLSADHALDVCSAERGNALVAVLGPELLKNLSARAARGFSPHRERRRAEVAGHGCGHGAGLDLGCAEFETWSATHSGLVCGHELGRPREPWQGNLLEARTTEIESRLTVSINVPVNVLRGAAHQTLSHSFSSPLCSETADVTIMLPALVISTRIRSISTPAATTALMARVTSDCRNVEGGRDISEPPQSYAADAPSRCA